MLFFLFFIRVDANLFIFYLPFSSYIPPGPNGHRASGHLGFHAVIRDTDTDKLGYYLYDQLVNGKKNLFEAGITFKPERRLLVPSSFNLEMSQCRLMKNICLPSNK